MLGGDAGDHDNSFHDIRMVNRDIRGWMGLERTSATEEAGWTEELAPQGEIPDAVQKKN